jgi:hypothetical protein
MTSKERILAAVCGEAVDYIPLTTWCFGLPAPPALQWQRDGNKVQFWYSKRMEHLHEIPGEWTIEDDFNRALAWQSLGVDDVLEVSVPWSMHPDVRWKDSRLSPRRGERYEIIEREYETPSGKIRHAVRKTGEDHPPGWVVQPDEVRLIEDFNIPRAVGHAVAGPEDIDRIVYLYHPPDEDGKAWFGRRMDRVADFASTHGFPVQAWAGFGMDAAVWFAGTEGAIMLALDHPGAFGKLMEIITEADVKRAELAGSHPGVDIIAGRGWYSSTDFWSPALFDSFVYPHIKALADTAHRYGKPFAYVMTTGIEILGPKLADAGVDILYFLDPIDPTAGGEVSLPVIKELLGGRMTVFGGVSALTLNAKNIEDIERQVKNAIDHFGPTGRFVLHPVDALFPDTSWTGLDAMIDIWKDYR